MATPTHQEGGYNIGYYVGWIAGGLVVGAGAGIVAGVNPIATAIAALGALLVGNGLTILSQWVRTSGSEPTSIASIGADSRTVQVVGTARQDSETVTAPYTGEDCLAYAVAVESYQNPGETWTWETEYSQSNSRPFLVDDGTGTAWVDPTNAQFNMSVKDRVNVDPGEEPPERVRKALTDRGPATPRGREPDAVVPVGDEDGVSVVNDYHERRFTEYRLEAGEELSINGESRAAPDSDVTSANPSVTITDGDSTAVYSISTDPDRDVGNQLLQQAATPIVIGGVLFVGGLAWAFVV